MATAVITNGFIALNGCDDATGISGNAQVTDTAVFKEGTGSQSFTLTASKKVIDVTTFENTATWSAGDSVRFWFNFALPSELATAAAGGIAVELSDGTNTAFYEFLGSDNYGGGWVLGSVDISTGTIISGTRPTGTLTSIGIEILVTGVLRNATNCWVDNFHIGSGYSVYGGTDGDEIGMDEIVAADVAGGWGLVQKSGGSYQITGKLNIGDNSSTNATYFLDSAKSLSFTHTGSISATGFDLTIAGNTTGVTDVNMLGLFIQGDTNPVTIDFNDSNIDALYLLGCTFTNTNNILFTDDSTHYSANCIFVNCDQIVPLGSTFVNHTITNYVGTDGAMLWPADDTNCYGHSFTNNDIGVEYGIGSDASPAFISVVFDDVSGNFDVNNTSGAIVTISLLGTSNANSFTGAFDVTFQSSNILNITVINEATQALLDNARVHVVAAAGGTMTEGDVIINAEITGADGKVSGTISAVDQPYIGLITEVAEPGLFVPKPISGTIPSGSTSITVGLVYDE